jgi:predicted ATP-dependent Lon-type protease
MSGWCAEPDHWADRPTIQSKTVLNTEQFRIDVENRSPGLRPGQIHLQTNTGQKFLYDFKTNTFDGASKSFNKALSGSDSVQKAISKAYKYLGMKK